MSDDTHFTLDEHEADITHFTLGEHEADIRSVKAQLATMSEELTAIRVLLAETKGGVRMLVAVGTIGGAVGGALVKLIAAVKGMP